MIAGTFDAARCRSVYNERLKPVFLGHKPIIQLDDRNEFYLRLLGEQHLLKPGNRIVDLGAGLSVFGPLCSQLGLRVSVVDDFGGGGGVEPGQRVEDTHLLEVFQGRFGIEVVRSNFLEEPLPMPDSSVDAVTCFHSLEHWHHSPRRLFREIVRILKPGGWLLLATPNAVNLRKRFYVLLGKSNLPSLQAWYIEGDPVFRGHVREPVIRDLHEILRMSGLEVVLTRGRNFIGRSSRALAFLPPMLVRMLARISDYALAFFPSLCSDIHVVGRKPPTWPQEDAAK